MNDQRFIVVLWMAISISDIATSVTRIPPARHREVDMAYLSKVVNNMRSSLDPCEDFYAYACGNWTKNYLPPDSDYVDMPGYMERQVNERLLTALHNTRSGGGDFGRKVFDYYRSCVTLPQPAALNHYLLLLQHELNFTWPIFREWHDPWLNETNFDWLGVVARLKWYGLRNVFITNEIGVRLDNSSHHLLQVSRHSVIPKLALHCQQVMDIFTVFGMNRSMAEDVTDKIIRLEYRIRKLADVSLEELRKSFPERIKEMTLQELMDRVPSIDWLKYFGILLERTVDPQTMRVQTFLLDMQYFVDLQSVLRQTANETIAHYLMLKLMYHLDTPVLSDNRNSSMACVRHLRESMPLAMNFLYEEHEFKGKRKRTEAAVREMFDKLRSKFLFIVEEENLMNLTASQIKFIRDKLQAMPLKLGNVPQNLTEKFVTDYYIELKVNASDFYANHLNSLRFSTLKEHQMLLNTPTPEELQFYQFRSGSEGSSSPLMTLGGVLVPHGYLQPPMYDAELNSLYQYSLFGFILAHEIMHAFDAYFILFDRLGNYNHQGYDILQSYAEVQSCVARSSGVELSETLADLGGIRLAYETYFANNSEYELAFTSDHLNLTTQQLFFINSVQFLCANMTNISEEDFKIHEWGHEMHDRRVRWHWRHYEKFAEAFKCPEGSNMNACKKCRWF